MIRGRGRICTQGEGVEGGRSRGVGIGVAVERKMVEGMRRSVIQKVDVEVE